MAARFFIDRFLCVLFFVEKWLFANFAVIPDEGQAWSEWKDLVESEKRLRYYSQSRKSPIFYNTGIIDNKCLRSAVLFSVTDKNKHSIERGLLFTIRVVGYLAIPLDWIVGGSSHAFLLSNF